MENTKEWLLSRPERLLPAGKKSDSAALCDLDDWCFWGKNGSPANGEAR